MAASDFWAGRKLSHGPLSPCSLRSASILGSKGTAAGRCGAGPIRLALIAAGPLRRRPATGALGPGPGSPPGRPRCRKSVQVLHPPRTRRRGPRTADLPAAAPERGAGAAFGSFCVRRLSPPTDRPEKFGSLGGGTSDLALSAPAPNVLLRSPPPESGNPPAAVNERRGFLKRSRNKPLARAPGPGRLPLSHPTR